MSLLLPITFADVARQMTVRILKTGDASAFRSIILDGLQRDGEWLGPTYESESRTPSEKWVERCHETPEQATFGLFYGPNFVGVMRACKSGLGADDKTAFWGAEYLQSEYRGLGLASSLYKARMEWTQRHPNYERAVLYIHDKNEHSQNIHIKNGAQYMFTRQMEWPGRPTAPWHWYEVPIAKKHL